MEYFNKAMLTMVVVAALIAGGFYYRYQRDKLALEGQKWLQQAQEKESDRFREMNEETQRKWKNNTFNREPKVNYLHR